MTDIVWITRTQPAADTSAEIWRDAGFEPLVLPLLDIVPVEHEDLSQDSVVVFTSKNAVDHFSGSGHRAICVGDATAAHARGAGFRDVVSVNGTSQDVTTWVLSKLPKTQSVTHISGRHVRGSIIEDLKQVGYSAKRLRVYESKPIVVWPDGPFNLVALYSPLAAKTFAELAMSRDISDITTVSISPATDNILEGMSFRARWIAEDPTEAALVRAAVTP